MSEYIRPGTKFPNFYQFPDFLLQAPLSQTAKLAYMVLYDRARLSKKNDWTIDGKIYTVYPVADLAAVLGRSQSTIKAALNELGAHGMLIRKSGGFAKANILYVLIPDKGQFSDEMSKLHVKRGKNSTSAGELSVPMVDGILTPNKVIESNNKSQNNRVIQRSALGMYKNIYLSEEEYSRLKQDFPDRIDYLIEQMSSYLAANGKAYKNCDAALRNWAGREKNKNTRTNKKSGFPDYSFKEGESY